MFALTLKKSGCIIAIIAAAFCATFAGKASAEVYPQSPFHAEAYGGSYDGLCTTNFVEGRFINTCHASLTSGTAVLQNTKLYGPNLHGVITPSGQLTEEVAVSFL